MRRAIGAAALGLWLGGCASHVLIPPAERADIERELSGPARDQFLRVSYFVTPFFGDASRRLLTPYPPEEVRLLNDTRGSPINPGEVEQILPAGTRVRIRAVEFPTGLVVAERVLYSPRTQPWVSVEASGDKGAPLTLVLRPQIKDRPEFEAELSRYLTPRDPKAQLEAFSEPLQVAIREKKWLPEMPAEALMLSFGEPERKKVRFEIGRRQEQWIYPGGRRVAHLNDGRLDRVEEVAPAQAP